MAEKDVGGKAVVVTGWVKDRAWVRVSDKRRWIEFDEQELAGKENKRITQDHRNVRNTKEEIGGNNMKRWGRTVRAFQVQSPSGGPGRAGGRTEDWGLVLFQSLSPMEKQRLKEGKAKEGG